ncbi:hypothetical protein PR003_g24319 [Phytophthora rubi]|uniref:Uncharacterized protein n=1 Tax=Phytophthora rubi TaxID=129364 RepID=A0A6A3IJ76_9STRA|nr:hypothetical protein PR002_g23753 [Phytophthora rubi]KAE8984507.1 hypothetical protein PR001_g23152 [Phytophthora rubi]KAE9294179.1 hypothetical protein PR003_g24319 [Phytophthora rubi]
MQKSPSVWTTTVLMLIDVLVRSIALHDLKHAYRELIEIRERIEKVKFVQPTRLPIMEFLHILLDTNIQTSSPVNTYPTTISIMPAKYGENRENPQPSNMKSVEVARSFRALRIFNKRNKTYPGTQMTPVDGNSPRTCIRISLPNQYIFKMQKILYVVQFLLFVNYVEVITPLVYCTCWSNVRKINAHFYSNATSILFC